VYWKTSVLVREIVKIFVSFTNIAKEKSRQNPIYLKINNEQIHSKSYADTETTIFLEIQYAEVAPPN